MTELQNALHFVLAHIHDLNADDLEALITTAGEEQIDRDALEYDESDESGFNPYMGCFDFDC